MTLEEKIIKIHEIFDKLYPDADCTLKYSDPFQLLVATQLAAQCTDARVNMVTPALFDRYPTPLDFANADTKELESYIKSTGFFRNKAKNLIACGKTLVTKYKSKVPNTMDELISLPGVGRKTANLILGDIFKIPSIVIDTHAGRITKRIGLTENTNPKKIEFDLIKIVPDDYKTRFCHQLVLHGRNLCTARNPKCKCCPLGDICNYYSFISK